MGKAKYTAKRICVVTAGHLSTCPRMLKAADALAEAGYDVRVVSARYMDWAWQADQDVRRKRLWKWTVVNYDRWHATSKYLQSGIRLRSAQVLAKALGPSRCPLGLVAQAYGRAHNEILKAILDEPVDLIYGGTSGALAAAGLAAARAGVPYALDLEDFHTAEHGGDSSGRFFGCLAERIECAVLPHAAFITAGSAAIAQAYRHKRGVKVMPLHNTFPLPASEPDFCPTLGESLRLYWFGQTIGPGRGLETVVQAMGEARIPGELHLRGNPVRPYLRSLHLLAAETAPKLSIVVHEPASPDLMVDLCREYHLGLATEPGLNLNNQLALSNKALTYVLAGLAVIITDTPGQFCLARDLGEGAIVYKPSDTKALSASLKRWSDDKPLRARAKAAAWEAAKRRWHWEHPEERGALLKAVAGVFH